MQSRSNFWHGGKCDERPQCRQRTSKRKQNSLVKSLRSTLGIVIAVILFTLELGLAAKAQEYNASIIAFDVSGAGTDAHQGTFQRARTPAIDTAGYHNETSRLGRGFLQVSDGLTTFDAPDAETGPYNQGSLVTSIDGPQPSGAIAEGHVGENETDAVKSAITNAYSGMRLAAMHRDQRAWFEYIAPRFNGVGQYGNILALLPPGAVASGSAEAGTQESPASSDTPAPPSQITVLSEDFLIQKVSVSGDAALALVRHRTIIRLIGDSLNGWKLEPKAEHKVRMDEVMREIWVRISSKWKLKHEDDLSGKILVDGKVLESWAVDRIMVRPEH